MTIRARVMSALASVGIPVYFGGWHPAFAGEQPPDAYLVFTTASAPDTHEDDVRTSWEHYVYLNLWTKGAFNKDTIFNAMESAGFEIVSVDENTGEDVALNLWATTWWYWEGV